VLLLTVAGYINGAAIGSYDQAQKNINDAQEKLAGIKADLTTDSDKLTKDQKDSISNQAGNISTRIDSIQAKINEAKAAAAAEEAAKVAKVAEAAKVRAQQIQQNVVAGIAGIENDLSTNWWEKTVTKNLADLEQQFNQNKDSLKIAMGEGDFKALTDRIGAAKQLLQVKLGELIKWYDNWLVWVNDQLSEGLKNNDSSKFDGASVKLDEMDQGYNRDVQKQNFSQDQLKDIFTKLRNMRLRKDALKKYSTKFGEIDTALKNAEQITVK
jgi:hypothetical protein